MDTEAKDGKKYQNFPTLKPHKKVLPTHINYQRHKTTFFSIVKCYVKEEN